MNIFELMNIALRIKAKEKHRKNKMYRQDCLTHISPKRNFTEDEKPSIQVKDGTRKDFVT